MFGLWMMKLRIFKNIYIRLPVEPDIVNDNEEIDEECTKIVLGKILCNGIGSEETAKIIEILNRNEMENIY